MQLHTLRTRLLPARRASSPLRYLDRDPSRWRPGDCALNLAPWVCFSRVFPSAFSLSHSASHPAVVFLFLPLLLSLQQCCEGLEANSSIYESRTYKYFFYDDPQGIDSFLSNQDILKHIKLPYINELFQQICVSI